MIQFTRKILSFQVDPGLAYRQRRIYSSIKKVLSTPLNDRSVVPGD
ncbi:MAG: hypothetical protein HQM08_05575 [Candidatus Riflebacteria bacterium]|nr:hypothetical protein [Candidatus Riflebacteria bacterium]